MIPKIIHFMWMPDFSKAPAYASENIESWRERNKDYEVLFWDEESARKIIPDERIDAFDSLDMPIKKADFARIEILIKFGGVYLDCDLIPNNNLEYFFEKKSIEKPRYDKEKNLHFDNVDCDMSKKRLIFSREWKDAFPKEKIFSHISRVANGVIMAEPDHRLLEGFIDRRHKRVNEKVLKYLGPHALTVYLHIMHKKLMKDELVIIPPHHFLWEKSVGKQTDWSISKHLGENTWGDHSKTDYWDI